MKSKEGKFCYREDGCIWEGEFDTLEDAFAEAVELMPGVEFGRYKGRVDIAEELSHVRWGDILKDNIEGAVYDVAEEQGLIAASCVDALAYEEFDVEMTELLYRVFEKYPIDMWYISPDSEWPADLKKKVTIFRSKHES